MVFWDANFSLDRLDMRFLEKNNSGDLKKKNNSISSLYELDSIQGTNSWGVGEFDVQTGAPKVDGRNFWGRLKRVILSQRSFPIYISLLVHLLIVAALISIVFTVKVGILGDSTSLSFSDKESELSFNDDVSGDELSQDFTVDITTSDALEQADLSIDSSSDNNVDEDLELASKGLLNSDSTEFLGGTNGLGGEIPFFSKKGVTSARSTRSRQGRIHSGRQGDVTQESEDAVERGLEWLARHQLPDGSWAFDLSEEDSNGRHSSCRGCSNSFSTSGGDLYKTGLHPSRMAATAIAILPFLGAGYTHTDTNKYQKTVAAGLRYLEYHAVSSSEKGVDFRAGFTQDGAAYIQALVVLACCEAYEMTRDPNLKSIAQGGLKKIEDSQLADGGWRYNSPGDLGFHATVSGDVSVLGWQMMALKSGISAGFTVQASVAYRAGNFLDMVTSKDSKTYRYQPESAEKKNEMWGTTAVGALTREYLGWEPGNHQLDAVVKQIADWIDDADSIWQKVKKGGRASGGRNGAVTYYRDDRLVYNLYFSYYAALALHHYGGSVWSDHFGKIRDLLIETQNRSSALNNSCEDGSWLFYDKYMNDGGRLLNTSLAILILETPYRYLPMYQ